jgi:Zn-dependent metalloprotease
MSDVFGEFIDLGYDTAHDAAADRWIIGEDWSALRDMADPPRSAASPRTSARRTGRS